MRGEKAEWNARRRGCGERSLYGYVYGERGGPKRLEKLVVYAKERKEDPKH